MSILQSRRDRQIKAGTGITVTDAGNNRTVAIDAAVQSDQETASSTAKVVVPGVQQFHPSAAKCWAYVTVATGTPTLQTSYNITSITDSGVGLLTITIATDFSSANWAGLCTIGNSTPGLMVFERDTTKAAGSVRYDVYNAAGSLTDPLEYNFVGFGDQ